MCNVFKNARNTVSRNLKTEYFHINAAEALLGCETSVAVGQTRSTAAPFEIVTCVYPEIPSAQKMRCKY